MRTVFGSKPKVVLRRMATWFMAALLCLTAVAAVPALGMRAKAASEMQYSINILGGSGYVTLEGDDVNDPVMSTQITSFAEGCVIHLVPDKNFQYQTFKGWSATVVYIGITKTPGGRETTKELARYEESFTENLFAPTMDKLSSTQRRAINLTLRNGEVICSVLIEGWTETQKSTITFSAGTHGTGSMDSVTVDSGSIYTLPVCGFTGTNGYDFMAWNLGNPMDRVEITGDTVITAIWDKKCTINFDANGGTGSMPFDSISAGSYTLPDCGFTPQEGYEFDAWDAGAPGTVINVDNNICLKALWKELPYSVALTSDNFEDAAFLDFVKQYDKDGNEVLTASELMPVKSMAIRNQELTNLKGIENFQWLEELSVRGCSLTEMDVRACKNLKTLDCSVNNLTALDLSGMSQLVRLTCGTNPSLTSLNLTGCTGLERIDGNSTGFTSLDLQDCTNITWLAFSSGKLTSLDVTACKKLVNLQLDNNTALTELKLDGLSELAYLYLKNCNLTSIDLSGLTKLNTLEVSGTPITSLEVGHLQNLSSLTCNNVFLSSLDLRKNAALTKVECKNAHLKYLWVDGLSNLSTLNCTNNELATLDLSGDTMLEKLYAAGNFITDVNLQECEYLTDLDLSSNLLEEIDLSGCRFLYFVSLGSTNLKHLDVRQSAQLMNLSLEYTKITNLDVSNNSILNSLNLSFTQINVIDISNNPKLKTGGEGILYVDDDVLVLEHVFNKWELTLSADPKVGGKVYGAGNWFDKETVAVSAYPAEGYVFQNWTFGSKEVSTDADYAFGIERNSVLVAHFVKGIQVTFDANGGTGSMQGVSMTAGSKYELPECAFLAPEGKAFAQWNLGKPGDIVELSEDTVIKPQWADGGKISISYRNDSTNFIPVEHMVYYGAGTYVVGSEVAVSAWTSETDSPYIVQKWLENGKVVSTDPEYTFTVTGDRNLVAVLVDAHVMNFYAMSGYGFMEPMRVKADKDLVLPKCTFTPPSGKVFAYWEIDGAPYLPGETVAFGTNNVKSAEAIFCEKKSLDTKIAHTCAVQNNLALNYKVTIKTAGTFDKVWLHIDRQVFKDASANYSWESLDLLRYAKDTDGRYVFTFSGIAAAEMGNIINATVYAIKDGQLYESIVDEYSIKAYAESAIDAYENSEIAQQKKLVTLLVDMLNYGAQAQIYFGRHTDYLANEKLTASQLEKGSPLAENFKNELADGEFTGTVTAYFDARTLSLGNSVVLNAFAKYDNAPGDNVNVVFSYKTVKKEARTVKVEKKDFTYDGKKNRYCVSLDSVAAADFSQPITITIYDGTTQISKPCIYSYGSYAYAAQESYKTNSGNATLGKLVTLLKYMMTYSEAAKAFFQ